MKAVDNSLGFNPVRLSDIAEVILSNVDKVSDDSEIPVHLCNYTDVYYSYRINDSESLMKATATKREIERFKLRCGDLIITKDSESSDDIAVPALVTKDMGNTLCGYHLAIIRSDKSLSDPGYLLYLFQEQAIRHYFFTLANGVTRFGLTSISIQRAQLPLPPLPEQKKIAEILGTCDEAIEAQERLIKLKQDRKNGLMQQLLTGRKRFPGHLQQPWRDVKLGSVLKHVFRPVEWSAELDLNLVSIRRRAGGLFKRPEMKGSEFKTSDLHEIRTNDFLISKRQVTHGAMAVVQPEFEGGMVSKEYTIFENKDPRRLHMPFMGWLAQTREMWHKAYVASNGVVIEKLIFTPKDFLKFKISLPPSIEEQIQIAEFLDAVQEEIDLSMRKLEGLKQQKKGLMQQLLTGKVRVKV